MSHHQEDTIIAELLFERGIEKGCAVEVGAAAGGVSSNVAKLEAAGWTCLFVEPNPLYYQRLKERHPLVIPVAVAAEPQDWADFTVMRQFPHEDDFAYEAGSALKPRYDILAQVGGHIALEGPRMTVPVRVETLDWCLWKARFTSLEVASIDVEGGEMDVLKGWSLGTAWNPAVLVIENWLEGPEQRAYLEERGYRMVARTGSNDIYVPKEAKDGHPPAG